MISQRQARRRFGFTLMNYGRHLPSSALLIVCFCPLVQKVLEAAIAFPGGEQRLQQIGRHAPYHATFRHVVLSFSKDGRPDATTWCVLILPSSNRQSVIGRWTRAESFYRIR